MLTAGTRDFGFTAEHSGRKQLRVAPFLFYINTFFARLFKEKNNPARAANIVYRNYYSITPIYDVSIVFDIS